jgi:surface antigen
MKKLVSVIAIGAVGLSLAACEGNYGPKQTGGAVIGGAAGGLLGSKIGGGKGRLAATAIGTLLGVLAGSEVGKSLDRADKLYAERTTQNTLEKAPTGKTSSWTNPDSGHSGTVTPTRTYQTAQGQNCREYQQTVTIDGKTERAYGTACRQPDGSWKIAN